MLRRKKAARAARCACTACAAPRRLPALPASLPSIRLLARWRLGTMAARPLKAYRRSRQLLSSRRKHQACRFVNTQRSEGMAKVAKNTIKGVERKRAARASHRHTLCAPLYGAAPRCAHCAHLRATLLLLAHCARFLPRHRATLYNAMPASRATRRVSSMLYSRHPRSGGTTHLAGTFAYARHGITRTRSGCASYLPAALSPLAAGDAKTRQWRRRKLSARGARHSYLLRWQHDAHRRKKPCLA